ncbi:MAG: SPFH domain-containing protein [Promethearchaeota archaeon]
MIEEIEGLQRGYIEMLLERKYFIAEMPHLFEDEKEDYGLLNKRLAFRLRLKSPDEDFFTSEEYWNNPNNLTFLKERERALYANKVKGSLNIFKRAFAKGRRDHMMKKYTEDALGRDIKELKRGALGGKKKSFDADIGVEKLKEKGFTPSLNIDAFVVKEHEACLFFQQGRLLGEVPSGIWVIEPRYQTTGTEIVWVDKSEVQFKWGVGGNVYTSDFAKVGAHGICSIRVKDPKRFVMNMISSKRAIDQEEVVNYINHTLKAAIEREIQNHPAIDLLRKRDEMEVVIKARLYDDFDRWGIELVQFIVSGFKLPEELQRSLEKRFQTTTAYAMDVETEMSKLDLEAKLEIKSKLKDHKVKSVDQDLDIEFLEREKERLRRQRELELLDKQMDLEAKKYDAKAAFIDQDVRAGEIDIDEKAGMARARVGGAMNVASQKATYDIKMTELDIEKEKARLALELERDRVKLSHETRIAEIESDRQVGMKWGTDVRVAQAEAEAAGRIRELDARVDMAKAQAYMGRFSPAMAGQRISEIERLIEEKQRQLSELNDQLSMQRISQRVYDDSARQLNQQIQQLQDELKGLKRMML